MSVEIDPLELGFRRPFTGEVTQTLKIKNPNHTPVAFKVKTTAPKQYCVRPNSGLIEPGDEIVVIVILQAMKQEPPEGVKCRDKFLVQSVAVDKNEFSNWQHVDSIDKSSVKEIKIRVLFLPAIGSTSAVTPQRNSANGYSNSEDHPPPAYRSPSPDDHSIPQAQSTPAVEQALPPDSHSASNKNQENVSTAEVVPNPLPPSVEELQAQLFQAKAMLAGYGQEGLRMRRPTNSRGDESTNTTESIQQQNVAGVPIQIVAVLCLLSFLLAYLFF